MGTTVASCSDLATAASLSSLHVSFPRTGHFLIMVLSPLPDPELILRKYFLKDCSTLISKLEPSKKSIQLFGMKD